MQNNPVRFWLKKKDGLQIIEPSERLSISYMNQAKSSLLRAEKNLLDGDLIWSTVAAYYSEYYALYSFLIRIGLKTENHACSIAIAEILLSKGMTELIRQHKDKRIDAQYYIQVGKDTEIKEMIAHAKKFVSLMDNISSNLSGKEIISHRDKILKEAKADSKYP